MIHKITIENYFSIAEEQTVDFGIAANVPDLSCFVPSRANHEKRLPTIIGFFGANASGKSTVLRSVVSILSFVSDSFFLKPDGIIPYFVSYASGDWLEKPTKISIEFDCPLPEGNQEYLFKYQLTVLPGKYGSARSVGMESLFYKPHGKWKNLFERDGQKFRFGKEFGISDNDQRVEFIRPNASLVNALAQFNHRESQLFLQYVLSTQKNITTFGIVSDHTDKVVDFYKSNPELLENLRGEIRRVDIGVESVDIVEGKDGSFLAFQHNGLTLPLILDDESNGTQQFIRIFPKIKNALDTGSLAIIDELDSVLHPSLINEIFSWFNDPYRNANKAQLLFSAHNPALLDALQKEQVFLTEKKSPEATRVYGAKDIKGLRREPSLSKKYLSGELGAIPVIG